MSLLLVVVLVGLTGAAPATAGAHPDATPPRESLAAALAAGDWEAAVAPAETLAFLAQTAYLESLYELMTIHCGRGAKTAAYATLDDLLAAGWWDHRRLLQDPALALINEEERCRKAVREAWTGQYISMLERDSRDAMQMPDEIMAALALRPGERVADVGAGSGYFTLRVAHAVGETGKVWAVDIRQEMLDHIAGRVAEAGLTNVELRCVPADDPQLPPGGVDTILMVDTMHYVEDRAAYGRKLRAGLAPGGRLVVIDFRYDPDAQREFAPPPRQQVPRAVLDADLAAAGLKVVAAHDFLPEQYFVVYGADVSGQ